MFHGTITEELTSHREWSHYNENIIEDQKDFVFVKFSGLHLKSMENMQSCISLRVCIFSNNFITDIRPLQSCIKLVKLDLHGNQGSAYEDEINNIKHIISKINEILAHNSPVLIVQRWIRGFLVRKKMSPLFLRKKHQKKINECEAKWIYIHRRYEDKLFKDLFFLPGTNKTEKLPRWKYNIYSPVDLQISSEQRKHVSSISYELKTKRPRHLIQKGQKETEDEIEDEESDVSFRISAFKLPIHTADSLKYAAVLNEKQRDYFPAYAQPFPTTHQKPVIRKKDMLLERSVRREFFTTQRAGMKFHALHDSEKYCSEQKKQESHKNKVTAVSMAQVAQERVRLAVQENLNNKIHATQKLSAKDNETIQDGLRRLWQDRSNYLEKVKERRALFLEEKKQRAKDRLLIQNLSNERTLLIKGITKIERLGKKKDVLKEKRLIVQQKLKTEKYQKDLRKQMKEIRAQEIHKRHCEEKFVNDMIAFQKACERFQDAKTRAATVKTNLGFKVPSGMTQ
ncbi:leucine-rich repeat and IQ domain-containing protein 3 isoform X2 [Camelus bactrianus]|uniref:Leucine-rich repeat and IQ domain-containing protein 3 isoform X2 n=1 Tax=Camelus bactrianus TaxID=9837 RepID=A0A9W3GH93_CAMBA|nr:leucine-rich repeat and IQ domain-containing protein 3 isoform X2 [Camelus bactrianus]